MARKKTKSRSVYITTEPNWKEMSLLTDPAERDIAFRKCEYFVRTEIASRKTVPVVKEWIKNKSGWDKEDIKIILVNPDWAFGPAGNSLFVESKLGYMPDNVIKHYERRKEEWIARGKKLIEQKATAEAEKPKKKVISIQERMRQQMSDLCGEFEHQIDMILEKEMSFKEFDPYKEMITYTPEVKANHAKIIKELFEEQYKEALEVKEWKDEQLKEGYSHLDAKQRKEFVSMFEKINTACDTIIETKKSTRKARKPRARSKETIVKKLKYQINDSELGIASIAPTEVVNANELWVYNTKTRKIGVYHARSKDPRNMGRDGLTVKGTTIKDFDPDTSLQKTLRKPKEQISNWTGKAKTKFAKAFDEVKTVESKMNGRINDSTILLKVF